MYPITFITRADKLRAANRLEVPLAVIDAIARIEGGGRSGFIKDSDLPIILFEGHQFRKFTRKKYDSSHPELSHPYKESRHYYKGERGEYDRLRAAINADEGRVEAALKSASWGKFQIMGFNHQSAGYDDVESFVNAISMGEDYHLDAFISFILNEDLAAFLQEEKWAEFARRYNGPDYKRYKYDTKLAAGVLRRRVELEQEAVSESPALERGDMIVLQTALNLELDAGLVPDGWYGPKTANAIRLLETRDGITPVTGKPTKSVFYALELSETWASYRVNSGGND